MQSNLILHAGGWDASPLDLDAVPQPQLPQTYQPVPYNRLIDEVLAQIPRFHLRVEKEQYALARGGMQMFGVLSCSNGRPAQDDYCLAIGVRSSYDRSLSVQLVAGIRVFVCDNLAFAGEVHTRRKHTAHALRDLPSLVYEMLTQAAGQRSHMDQEIAALKGVELQPATAHHLLIEALRGRIVTAARLPNVLREWEKPRHEQFQVRTAWSLLNAFTEVAKEAGPRVQMDASAKLLSLFRRELRLV